MALGFTSDPHVQYLSQILAEIALGHLKIPKFQRPVVWEWDRQLDLLRSIRDGIPMGAVMVWRTNTNRIRSYENFGKLKLPTSSSTGANVYLLDGVQRLSTLIAALSKDLQKDVNESKELDLEELDNLNSDPRKAYFDLKEEDFVAIDPDSVEFGRHLDLSILYDSVELLKFQRQLPEVNVERRIRLCDELAKAFKEYKVPVIPIATDEVELASLTFKRINSSGVQMSELHMLHALTLSNDFHLIDRLEDLREKLINVGWQTLDDELLLRTIKASLELDIYKALPEVVGKKLRSSPGEISRLATTAEDVASFLWAFARIPSPEFVPYGVQIIGLCEYFRNLSGDIQPEAAHELISWLWRTTYYEVFTGMSGDKVNAQIGLLRSAAKTGDPGAIKYALPFLRSIPQKKRFDFRAARSRALVTQLVWQMDRYMPDTGSNLIRFYGRQAVQCMLPKTMFREDPSMYFHPANRVLVPALELGNLRFRVANGHVLEEEMHAHFLTAEIIEIYQSDDAEGFVESRSQLIDGIEDESVFNRELWPAFQYWRRPSTLRN